jgi:hypothetical protein
MIYVGRAQKKAERQNELKNKFEAIGVFHKDAFQKFTRIFLCGMMVCLCPKQWGQWQQTRTEVVVERGSFFFLHNMYRILL